MCLQSTIISGQVIWGSKGQGHYQLNSLDAVPKSLPKEAQTLNKKVVTSIIM